MASDGTTSGPIRFSTPKLCKIGGFYTFPQKCLQEFSQGPFCEFPPVYRTRLRLIAEIIANEERAAGDAATEHSIDSQLLDYRRASSMGGRT